MALELGEGIAGMSDGEKERLFRDLGYIKGKLESIEQSFKSHQGNCTREMSDLWTVARESEKELEGLKAVSRRQGAGAGAGVAAGLVAAWEIVKAIWTRNG